MVAFLHKILRFEENFRVNSVFKKKKKELCIFCRELDTGNFLLLYLQISIISKFLVDSLRKIS